MIVLEIHIDALNLWNKEQVNDEQNSEDADHRGGEEAGNWMAYGTYG